MNKEKEILYRDQIFKMKNIKNFSQIGTIDEGELIMKLPGMDFKMPYKKGNAFLNNSGIGYVSLPIREFYCQKNGESTGLMGSLGEQMAEQLKNPSVKILMKEALALSNHSLFYSRAENGIEILCLPGMSGEDNIDDINIPNTVLATYCGNEGKVPSFEEIYAFHLSAVGERKIITDRSKLEKEVLRLVPKVNNVYESVLQLMKELGF